MASHCIYCNSLLEPSKHGLPKLYCNHSCRYRYRKLIVDAIYENAVINSLIAACIPSRQTDFVDLVGSL